MGERILFSAYTPAMLSKYDRCYALSRLGVKDGEVVIQPARCPVCNNYMQEIQMADLFLQCIECGATRRYVSYKDTFFKKKVN